MCVGAVTAMQMHYNEPRVHGAEVEEESTYSAPVALDLSVPRSWKPQDQAIVPFGL